MRYTSDTDLLDDILAARMGLRSASSRLWDKIGDHGRPPSTESGIGYIALCKAVALYDPRKCDRSKGATPYVGHFLAYYRQWCRKLSQQDRAAMDYPTAMTGYEVCKINRAMRAGDDCRPRAVSVELLDNSNDWSEDDGLQSLDGGDD